MKIKKSLILESGDGLGNGGEDEVAVFFTVLGKADAGSSPVPAPAKRAGDGVHIHTTFRAETDPEATIPTKFKEAGNLKSLN